MSATRTRNQPQSSDAVEPSRLGTPGHAYAQPGHDFVLQAIMELQKSVGEMNATMQGMKSSLDGVKSKVDDLVGWKHKILGGAAACAVVFAFLGFVIGKGSDYVTIKQPAQPIAAPVATPPAKP